MNEFLPTDKEFDIVSSLYKDVICKQLDETEALNEILRNCYNKVDVIKFLIVAVLIKWAFLVEKLKQFILSNTGTTVDELKYICLNVSKNIPQEIADLAASYDNEIKHEISKQNISSLQIENGVITDCLDKNIKSITILSNIIAIGTAAFKDCYDLESIIMQDGLEAIGDDAFTNCVHLQSITIPSSVKNIGHSVFANCKSIDNISIGRNIAVLPPFSFAGCNSLTYVKVPGNIKKIYQYAFSGCTKLKTVLIHEGVKVIEPYAFQNCRELRKISIPSSLTQVCGESFIFCDKLKSIYYTNKDPQITLQLAKIANVFDPATGKVLMSKKTKVRL